MVYAMRASLSGASTGDFRRWGMEAWESTCSDLCRHQNFLSGVTVLLSSSSVVHGVENFLSLSLTYFNPSALPSIWLFWKHFSQNYPIVKPSQAAILPS